MISSTSRSGILSLSFLLLLSFISIPNQTIGQIAKKAAPQADATSPNVIKAEIVAINQPVMYNRLGSAAPTSMIFALKSDVLAQDGSNNLQPGKVLLRSDKRPRPMVLRVNEGDIIEITLWNYLAPAPKPVAPGEQSSQTVEFDDNRFYDTQPISQDKLAKKTLMPTTRVVGLHIDGMELVTSIADDASWTGANNSSYVLPGKSGKYTLYAKKEGTYLFYSQAADVWNGGIRAAQIQMGLFGTMAVQPEGAEYYRSQVTNEDLALAADHWLDKDGNTIDPPRVGTGVDATAGYPVVNYQARFPKGHQYEGKYILKMMDDKNNLIYTDLTAIITGPDAGRFSYSPYNEENPHFRNVPATPDRRQPYREFAIHYHEAPHIVQAFSEFYEAPLNGLAGFTNGFDGFAINYGTGGIAAEILANRINVGPMWDCTECAFEEFFLSSWAVGDPAMVVDIPANASAATSDAVKADLDLLLENALGTKKSLTPEPGAKATKVIYPDDPSNVYHSYMRDHVKFRVSHAGAGVPHVHHQHAHQWLHSPNSDDGHYLDSQTINPGSSYTLEMVYNGSGNRNQTVGDQIFHCHFYPHFASGMWALWRVHDVLELGTELDETGTAVHQKSRALPDGEMPNGSATPGLVPMPTLAMAPIPAKVHIEDGQTIASDITANPGYPFFIPGIAGKRAPHPPMDIAIGDDGTGKIDTLDGGLPRSVVLGGNLAYEAHSNFDWTKTTDVLQVINLPEEGTPVEQAAMKAHATRTHPTFIPDGRKGNFILNGLPPAQGAPFADPAIDDDGNAVGTKRIYKAANIQMDVVLNKLGWHYPQQRIITLWEDIESTLNNERPPEPFFFRANTNEYIEFWHTNVVPQYYELDDFQVRTPTDVLGQHIHLVKFDVTSSDGAANGFNYEDGTFSNETVVDRIAAINSNGGKFYYYKYDPTKSIKDSQNGYRKTPLVPKTWKPKNYTGPAWVGARTSIQRWYADPLLNNKGQERTVRTVFTHDHLSPSTHQQVGFYAGLLVEPAQSKWYDPIGKDGALGTLMGTRDDGGPTSWQAMVVTEDEDESYREFAFEFQDTQLAYFSDSKNEESPYPAWGDTTKTNAAFTQYVKNHYRGWLDANAAINAPNGQQVTSASDMDNISPQLVSSGGQGTYSSNYRNEPLPPRVAAWSNVGGTPTFTRDASGNILAAGDLSHVFSSDPPIDRFPALMSQPTPGKPISSGSSFIYPKKELTPGMQGGDPFTPLLGAYAGDNVQIRTLVGAHQTEHLFNLSGLRWLFEPSEENSGYRSTQQMGISEHFEMLFTLPPTYNGNATSSVDYLYQTSADDVGLKNGLWGIIRAYNGNKTKAQTGFARLPNNPVETNKANLTKDAKNNGCPSTATKKPFTVYAHTVSSITYNRLLGLEDDNGIIFSTSASLPSNPYDIEPLVLRANSGECIQVTLVNNMDTTSAVFQDIATASYGKVINGSDTMNMTFDYAASKEMGLHAQLVSYDVNQSDGQNVGFNKVQTIKVGQKPANVYEWYAGIWDYSGDTPVAVPAEFGSIVLSASDPLDQYVHGMIGALIIEPVGAKVETDVNSPTFATVKDANGNVLFREAVLIFQDNISNGAAVNYKTEPFLDRYKKYRNKSANIKTFKQDSVMSNVLVWADPETPIFAAKKGTPVRFRVLHARGTGNGLMLKIAGHNWQEEPYQEGSTILGDNPLSQVVGYRGQLAAINSFDLLVDKAGGEYEVPGDYLYRPYNSSVYQKGPWGIFRVTDGDAAVVVTRIVKGTRLDTIWGTTTVLTNGVHLGKYAATVSFGSNTAKINATNGHWMATAPKGTTINATTFKVQGVKGITRGQRTYTKAELLQLVMPERLDDGAEDQFFEEEEPDATTKMLNEQLKSGRVPKNAGEK